MLSFRDAMLRQQLLLERLKGYYQRSFNNVLADIDADMRREFSKLKVKNLDELNKRELTKLVVAVNGKVRKHLNKWREDFEIDGKRLTGVDRKLAAQILSATDARNAAVSFFLDKAASADTLWASLINEVIGANGMFIDDMFNNYIRTFEQKVSSAIRYGYANNANTVDVLMGIVGSVNQARRGSTFSQLSVQAGAVTDTAIQHISTFTHESVQSKFYNRYRWISVLDERTTEVCRHRHNKIFEYGKGPLPPAHWRCRSTIAPAETANAMPEADDSADEWLARELAKVVTGLVGARIENVGETVGDAMRTAVHRPLNISKYADQSKFVLMED